MKHNHASALRGGRIINGTHYRRARSKHVLVAGAALSYHDYRLILNRASLPTMQPTEQKGSPW